MAKKETTEMTPEAPAVKPLELKLTKLSPKQTVLNLDTNEDGEITVESVRYELPKYDSAKHGTPAEFQASALAAATALVQPQENQIDALLKYATTASYQSGKTKALEAGNFLTQDLRKNIVQIMQATLAYADLKASDCFAKWRTGFAEKKPGAIKVLTMAQDMGSVEEF